MFIPSTFKRPVSSWKALNLRKTLLMASSVRLKPLNCSRLPCRSEERFSRNAETDLVCRLLLEKKKDLPTIHLLDPPQSRRIVGHVLLFPSGFAPRRAGTRGSRA